MIENEIGIKFGTRSTNGRLINSWEWYFNKITPTEMLDTITVLARYTAGPYFHPQKRETFLDEVRRIFKEENLAYEIDEAGGLHPFIDATFSAAMHAAIHSLNRDRYSVSAASVNRIDGYLMQDPPDFIWAIRSVFGACENTFKLMYGVPRLDAKTAAERIGPDQQRLYEQHRTLKSASAKTLEAFKYWVDAAHFYRHEPGSEQPNQPSEEMAVLLISQGLGFVRWLASLDQKLISLQSAS